MVTGMRQLDVADLGVLLSVFALLLIFFGIDFRVSRREATRHRRRALVFTVLSVVGETTTAVALILTWVALFLPPEAESIDTWLVFIPGSITIVCAVALTGEVVTTRVAMFLRPKHSPSPTGHDGPDPISHGGASHRAASDRAALDRTDESAPAATTPHVGSDGQRVRTLNDSDRRRPGEDYTP